MTGRASDGKFSAFLDGLSNLGIEPSLDGIRALCDELGGPQDRFDAIQITGTNGKTSTARMAQAILTEHGLKCGLYLSPHLERYEERLGIDGLQPDRREFDELGRLVRQKIADAEKFLGGRRITQFEALTAAAMVFFARRRVDLAVVEVGMGGRWDATSVINPRVAVVTNVTTDHAEWLGPKITDIAAEKAYCIRDRSVAVIGAVGPEVRRVLLKRAAEERAEVLESGADFTATIGDDGKLTLATPRHLYNSVSLGVEGGWQAQNAVLAVTAAEAYLDRPLSVGKVRAALAAVRSPGRAEIFPGRPAVLLDGAHNRDGVRVLEEYIRQKFAGRRTILLVSILRDKQAPDMLKKLAGIADDMVFSESDNPRCYRAEELRRLAADLGFQGTAVAPLDQALATAKTAAGDDGLVLVTGSLYLVGKARKLLRAGSAPADAAQSPRCKADER